MRNFLASLIFVAWVACAPASMHITAKPERPQPATTEGECLARSGTWGWHGATEVPGPFCALPTTDAGKPCSDYSQCQGHCLAPGDAVRGKKTSGRCAPFDFPGDCFNMVKNGRASGRICK